MTCLLGFIFNSCNCFNYNIFSLKLSSLNSFNVFENQNIKMSDLRVMFYFFILIILSSLIINGDIIFDECKDKSLFYNNLIDCQHSSKNIYHKELKLINQIKYNDNHGNIGCCYTYQCMYILYIIFVSLHFIFVFFCDSSTVYDIENEYYMGKDSLCFDNNNNNLADFISISMDNNVIYGLDNEYSSINNIECGFNEYSCLSGCSFPIYSYQDKYTLCFKNECNIYHENEKYVIKTNSNVYIGNISLLHQNNKRRRLRRKKKKKKSSKHQSKDNGKNSKNSGSNWSKSNTNDNKGHSSSDGKSKKQSGSKHSSDSGGGKTNRNSKQSSSDSGKSGGKSNKDSSSDSNDSWNYYHPNRNRNPYLHKGSKCGRVPHGPNSCNTEPGVTIDKVRIRARACQPSTLECPCEDDHLPNEITYEGAVQKNSKCCYTYKSVATRNKNCNGGDRMPQLGIMLQFGMFL